MDGFHQKVKEKPLPYWANKKQRERNVFVISMDH